MANSRGLTPQAGVKFDRSSGGYAGAKRDDDKYLIEARAEVKAPWAGAAAALMAGNKSFYRIPVRARSVGQAILKPGN